jgi:hypothetical protein
MELVRLPLGSILSCSELRSLVFSIVRSRRCNLGSDQFWIQLSPEFPDDSDCAVQREEFWSLFSHTSRLCC